MEAVSESKTTWNARQVYFAAALCFVLGVVMGYLLRPPSETMVASPKAAVSPARQMQMPSPEQLKSMADKQAQPLLAKLNENPNDPAVLAQLGKNYLYVRDYKQAIAYYERSVKIKADADVLTTLGGVYHAAGADEDAINAWDRALKVDPKHADALFNRGMVRWQAFGDPKAAITDWKTLLRTNPNHPRRAAVEQMIAQAKSHLNGTPTAKE